VSVISWAWFANPPAAAIKDNAVTVAGKTIRFDTAKGRLVLQ
jgi:hypothetical protein